MNLVMEDRLSDLWVMLASASLGMERISSRMLDIRSLRSPWITSHVNQYSLSQSGLEILTDGDIVEGVGVVVEVDVGHGRLIVLHGPILTALLLSLSEPTAVPILACFVLVWQSALSDCNSGSRTTIN